MGKGFDVLQRDFARGRIEGFAQFDLIEAPGKRMRLIADFSCSRYPLLTDRRQNIGAALNRCALHVMHDATNAAQLFAAARAARTTMHHVR